MHSHSPDQTYQQQADQAWLRIDLLLALYDAGIQTLVDGADAVQDGDEAALSRHRARVQRIVVEILDGLNPKFPETTDHIRQLALFVLSCIATNDSDRWNASAGVLQILRDAYGETRDDAVEFERQDQQSAGTDRAAISQLV